MSIHRLHGLWRTTPPNVRHEGFHWYDAAQDTIEHISELTGIERSLVCGVVAALSPNVRWETNILDAQHLIDCWLHGDAPDDIKASTYNRNKYKALDILSTGSVFPSLSGPKVEPFYHNLCGDYREVTVDSHIINAYLGYRAASTSQSPPNRVTLQRAIVRDIRRLASHHQLAPARVRDIRRLASHHQLAPARAQAILWCNHKRKTGGE
jgi:hypothetical protein